MTTVTSSGISIKKLITRLADLQDQRGHVHRPFFADMHGNRIKAKTIELELMEKLQVLKHSQPSQIPDDVDIYEDLGISRSFRWGATSTTRVQGVDDKHVVLFKTDGERSKMRNAGGPSCLCKTITQPSKFFYPSWSSFHWDYEEYRGGEVAIG